MQNKQPLLHHSDSILLEKTAGPLQSTTELLQALLQMYHYPEVGSDLKQAERNENLISAQIKSAIYDFQEDPNPSTQLNLQRVLQAERIRIQKNLEEFTQKKQFHIDQASKTPEQQQNSFSLQGMRVALQSFFASTDKQRAEVYAQNAARAQEHLQALDKYIAALNDMNFDATDTDTLFPPVLDVSDLDGENGFTIRGNSGSNTGTAVAGGDMDGDHYGDILIGQTVDGNDHTGRVYVVRGGPTVGASGDISLENTNSDTGLILEGGPFVESAGTSVHVIKDKNNDGINEIALGAPDYGSQNGRSYVVWGGKNISQRQDGVLPLNTLGEKGVMFEGEKSGDFAGSFVGEIGAIRDDKRSALAIGAPGGGNANEGEAYVIFEGSAFTGQQDFPLSDLTGEEGFKIVSQSGVEAYTGSQLVSGDFDGDGIPDLAVSSPFADDRTGQVAVIKGNPNLGSNGQINLTNLTAPQGYLIKGENPGDILGWSMAAGDLNRDGVDDLIIGAPNYDDSRGSAYVVYGGEHVGESGEILLSDLKPPAGVKIPGIESGSGKFGYALTTGDINGQGSADLVASAPEEKNGKTYVLFSEQGVESNLSRLDGNNGFVIAGKDTNSFTGMSLASTKVRGGTADDLIIGAPGSGEVHVIKGRDRASTDTPSKNTVWMWGLLPASLLVLGSGLYCWWRKDKSSGSQLTTPIVEKTQKKSDTTFFSTPHQYELEEMKKKQNSSKDNPVDSHNQSSYGSSMG